MTSERLAKILEDHKLWLANEGGSRADLRRAVLNGADLSGAFGLPSEIEFMAKHFSENDKGYIVYKTFGGQYEPPETWKIESGSIIEENVMFDRCIDYGSGINVAPLEWVQTHYAGEIWKCLIEWPWLAGVCVPYNTDGKVRCERVRLLEKVA